MALGSFLMKNSKKNFNAGSEKKDYNIGTCV